MRALFSFAKAVLAFGLALAIGLSSVGAAYADPKPPDLPADQVVVKLRAGTDIAAITARYGATVLGVVTETNLYLLQLPAGQTAEVLLPALNADPDLVYAEPNYYVDPNPGGSQRYFGGRGAFPESGQRYFGGRGDVGGPSPVGDWAASLLDLPRAQAKTKGVGLVVAVVDTGVDLAHPAFAGVLLTGYDFVGVDDDPSDRPNGLDDDGDGAIDESTGHGTHVAGIIHSVAPEAKILPVRVLNSDGIGTYWEVAQGIRYAADHGARVINLSLSAPLETPSLAEALNYAAARGIVIVAAAGDGIGPNYPAAFQPDSPGLVIGVGASDSADVIADFSGGLPYDTDVFAPGVGVNSAFYGGGTVLGTGTSMAAGFVSGEAALLLAQHLGWNAAQVYEAILRNTKNVRPLAGGQFNYTARQQGQPPGRIDALAAVRRSGDKP